MAYTLQQVVDTGRLPLNDNDKVRYSDDELLGYANRAVTILKTKRPDLFYGMFTSLPGDKALTDNLPVDDTIYPAICDYVTARAESKNDESILEQRAAMFFSLFSGSLQ
jgi:hypothetical protein